MAGEFLPLSVGALFLSRHFLPFFPSRFSLPSKIRQPPNFPKNRLMSLSVEGGGAAASSDDVIVQYVVLRRDLIDTWPLGSVVTQGCHAAMAAVWTYRQHPDVAAYCSDEKIDSMHKVTLEVKGETQLRNLAEKLVAGGIEHKLWIEQPENIPTCVATRPYPKSKDMYASIPIRRNLGGDLGVKSPLEGGWVS